jgi:uncharacterized membrane protein
MGYGGARRTACIIAVTLALLWPLESIAQTAPAAPPVTASASVGHAATKGLTLKAALALSSLTLFYVGTGSAVASGLLTLLVSGTSYTVYVTNEYLWDRYSPNTNVSANNQSFSTKSSISRNTLKFLTFKPTVMAVDWSTIYLYTGSLASMFTLGPAISLTSPIIFYLNNTAWDWYDWHDTPTVAAPGASAASAPTVAAPTLAARQ